MKIAFDGCGVTHGCCGTLFATGLREQTQVVRQKLEAIMLSPDLHKRRVRLNVVGLSRGGCAAIILAQELCHISGTELSMVQSSIFYMQLTDRVVVQALFLFDPVPGNLCWATTINCFNIASQCLDLSMCTNNLMNVTAIYPHEPLPDLAFHAPVIPRCVAKPSVV